MKRTESCKGKFKELGIITIFGLYAYHASCYIHKMKSEGKITCKENIHDYNTRRKNDLYIQPRHQVKSRRSVFHDGIQIYNSLPVELTSILRHTTFKTCVHKHFLDICAYKKDDIFSTL